MDFLLSAPRGFHLPASLCSTDITPFPRSDEGSVFWRGRSLCPYPLQISLFNALYLPDHSVSNHPTIISQSLTSHMHTALQAFLPRYVPPQRRYARTAFWTSHMASRLVMMSGRIEFVCLRTGRSPSVALHPSSRKRSYSRLQVAHANLIKTFTLLIECAHRRTSHPSLKGVEMYLLKIQWKNSDNSLNYERESCLPLSERDS